MTRKARLWVGITILAVITFNYLLIGIPLIKKSSYIETRSRAILMKQAKGAKLFGTPEDKYMLEILTREKDDIDRKALILNCAAASMAIFAASWVVFGLLFHRRK